MLRIIGLTVRHIDEAVINGIEGASRMSSVFGLK